VIAFIPSPDRGTIDLGPFVIHMYGLMLLVAIAACVALTGVRYVRRGGDWDLVLRVAVWGVAAGIVGARLYHDVTSWDEVPDPKWQGVFEVWKGGLGVWGGIFFGCIAGWIVVRRAGRSAAVLADAAAPGILLAQGIGRIGNWFNQELYGKPTDLPWGLEIDVEHQAGIPAKYQGAEAYHPTFLYELVYDLSMVGVLLLIDWRFRIRPPALFALYVSFYTFGRFFEELLRIDPSHEFAGLRLNAWVSLVLFVGSSAFFVWWQFFRRGEPGEERGQPRTPEGPRMAIPKGKRVRPGN
jgi:prolipoprotein diacylglyceryl transferase